MAYQASLNGGTRVPIDPAAAMVANIAEFGNDVATLAELQAKLAVMDLREAQKRATIPVALLVAALWLALGVVPVLLYGIAELLVLYAGLNLGWALLAASGGTLLLAAVLVFLGGTALSRCSGSFRRSQEELTRNIAWIRMVLLYSGRGLNRHP